MIKLTRFCFLSALLLIGAATAEAQDKDKVNAIVSADFVSQYIWRGQDLGNVSVQPTLGLDYKGLSLTAWGSVGMDSSDTKEFDLTLAYETGGFSIGVVDYWTDSGQDYPANRYFRYDAHGTNHVFEAFMGYDFGLFSLTWNTNFAGNDGMNEDGERAYSSYFEANVPFNLATCGWTATAGCVPNATDYYGTDGFAVTNISLKAVKDIRITEKFSVPVFAQIAANPCSQKAYLVFGLTL